MQRDCKWHVNFDRIDLLSAVARQGSKRADFGLFFGIFSHFCEIGKCAPKLVK